MYRRLEQGLRTICAFRGAVPACAPGSQLRLWRDACNASGEPLGGSASGGQADRRSKAAVGQPRTPTTSSASAAPHALQPGFQDLLASVGAVMRELGGSLSFSELAFMLQALSVRHGRKHQHDHLPGEAVTDASRLRRLLADLDLAHGTYKASAAALCAHSHLQVRDVLRWCPGGSRLRPGFYVALDHSSQNVVLAVRGTKILSDVLTDIAGGAHGLGDGHVHWGMYHSAVHLLREEGPLLASLLQQHRGYGLKLVGHSMGAGVAALMCHILHAHHNTPAVPHLTPAALPWAPLLRSAAGRRVSCVGFATPCILSAPLAAGCADHTVTVVLQDDPVPRLNAVGVRALRREAGAVDWASELRQGVMGTAAVQRMQSAGGDLAAYLAGQHLVRTATEPLLAAMQSARSSLGSAVEPVVQSEVVGRWLQAVRDSLPATATQTTQGTAVAECADAAVSSLLEQLTALGALTLPVRESLLDTYRTSSTLLSGLFVPTAPSVFQDPATVTVGDALPPASADAAVAAATQGSESGALGNVAANATQLGKVAAAQRTQTAGRRAAAPAPSTRTPSPAAPPPPPLRDSGPRGATQAADEARLSARPASHLDSNPSGRELVAAATCLFPPATLLYLRRQRGAQRWQHRLLQVAPGRWFRGLLLGAGALRDHRCRSYRRVLVDVVLHAEHCEAELEKGRRVRGED